MKRVFFGIGLLAVVAVLGGCPIYPSQQSEYQVCTNSGCYSCPDSSYSSSCTPWACQSDSDCNQGFSCDINPNDSTYLTCVPGSSYTGDASAPGEDCSVTGCPAGQVCKLANGVAQCVTLGGGEDGGGGSDAAGDSASSGDGGTTSEGGGDASGDGSVSLACNADSDCTTAGSKCIDGQCTTQLHLCSDGSQCNASGSACVDGVCEAHCSGSIPCPTGYSCDLTRDVCNINPSTCLGSGASSCLGGTTCVESHCVPPCSTSDAGPACPSGQVCVNGGCIPDQGASFACTNDGQSGQLATTCAANSICLHHDCYAACDADAGPSSAQCGPGQGCKSVTIETGTYSVCGTSTTLGSDCDPAQGKYCSGGKVCVDGFCE
jgi:hypothetical protein